MGRSPVNIFFIFVLMYFLFNLIFYSPRGEQGWGGAAQEEVQPLESGAVHAEMDAGVRVYTRA
jgi:hypothetical protein